MTSNIFLHLSKFCKLALFALKGRSFPKPQQNTSAKKRDEYSRRSFSAVFGLTNKNKCIRHIFFCVLFLTYENVLLAAMVNMYINVCRQMGLSRDHSQHRLSFLSDQ